MTPSSLRRGITFRQDGILAMRTLVERAAETQTASASTGIAIAEAPVELDGYVLPTNGDNVAAAVSVLVVAGIVFAGAIWYFRRRQRRLRARGLEARPPADSDDESSSADEEEEAAIAAERRDDLPSLLFRHSRPATRAGRSSLRPVEGSQGKGRDYAPSQQSWGTNSVSTGAPMQFWGARARPYSLSSSYGAPSTRTFPSRPSSFVSRSDSCSLAHSIASGPIAGDTQLPPSAEVADLKRPPAVARSSSSHRENVHAAPRPQAPQWLAGRTYSSFSLTPSSFRTDSLQGDEDELEGKEKVMDGEAEETRIEVAEARREPR